MPDPPIRVAIVGLGRMGLAHAAVINSMPGARVAAVVDRDKGLGRMAASMGLRAPFYADACEAVEREQASVAYVCTPTYTHQALVTELAALGLDLFVEKPLGHTLEASQAMARTARDKGLITAVGYNLSGERTFEKARELVAAGALGAPRRYEASAHHGEVFQPREGWLFDPARSGGGAAMNIGSHILWFALRCFGPPAAVSGQCRRLHSRAVEDEADIELTHAAPCAVTGRVHVSWSVPRTPILQLAMTIEGDAGALTVTRREILLRLDRPFGVWPAGESRLHAADLPCEAAYNFSPEYGGEGYYVESARFLACCRERRPYGVDFEAGVAVERVLDALYRTGLSGPG